MQVVIEWSDDFAVDTGLPGKKLAPPLRWGMDKNLQYKVIGRGAASGQQEHSSEAEARIQLRRAASKAAISGRPYEVTLHGPNGQICRAIGNQDAPERLRKA